jgi:hypothetical protein
MAEKKLRFRVKIEGKTGAKWTGQEILELRILVRCRL